MIVNNSDFDEILEMNMIYARLDWFDRKMFYWRYKILRVKYLFRVHVNAVLTVLAYLDPHYPNPRKVHAVATTPHR